MLTAALQFCNTGLGWAPAALDPRWRCNMKGATDKPPVRISLHLTTFWRCTKPIDTTCGDRRWRGHTAEWWPPHHITYGQNQGYSTRPKWITSKPVHFPNPECLQINNRMTDTTQMVPQPTTGNRRHNSKSTVQQPGFIYRYSMLPSRNRECYAAEQCISSSTSSNPVGVNTQLGNGSLLSSAVSHNMFALMEDLFSNGIEYEPNLLEEAIWTTGILRTPERGHTRFMDTPTHQKHTEEDDQIVPSQMTPRVSAYLPKKRTQAWASHRAWSVNSILASGFEHFNRRPTPTRRKDEHTWSQIWVDIVD